PPPPPPAGDAVTEEVVTAERKASAPVSGGNAPGAQDAAVSEFVTESPAPPPRDRGARLRAAAAAGQIGEVARLLRQGAPVDAADADGNTALMKSIQADQPAVAAILRRHGASLDRRNHAGESARDMATAKDDEALDRAIGVAP
ncbi:MAG: hypothetical protein ACHP7N_07125, partial [Caulobacterales bacterium]